MSEPLYEAVRACAIVLLGGTVLHACDVTAGNGEVIDWRTVKSGETLDSGGDAFDTAYLFVSLVGEQAAHAAATALRDVGQAPPVPRLAPRIAAYAPNGDGARRRSFDVGAFRVIVEPHEDDAAQAAFTEALALVAVAAAERRAAQ